MSPKSRPAPEDVKLEMKGQARDIVRQFRNGKPNLGAEIERALVNAWKAGRDAGAAGKAEPGPAVHAAATTTDDPDDPTPVPIEKLGKKTEPVLETFGLELYGVENEAGEVRFGEVYWSPVEVPFSGAVKWGLVHLDGSSTTLEKLWGDASLKACVKLGLFKPVMARLEGGGEVEVLVATAKTRPTYAALRKRSWRSPV